MNFTVVRTKEGYYRNERYQVELPWGDLTDKEQHKIKRKATLRMMAVTGGLALLASAWSLSGDWGENLPKSEAGEKMREEVADKYLEMSAREKFEATYVDPIVYKADYIEGASGPKGQLHYLLDDSYEYRFGQVCLAGRAYDTSPSSVRGDSGEINAVATLTAHGDEVFVHPAGSDAEPLAFELREGELFPNAATRETLLANDCRVADGLVVQRWDMEEGRLGSESFNQRLHPSNY
jgi:hypothetical protein